MNKKPDIEELFKAARRQQDDARRQQKLSEMIDRMATAEMQPRRRPLWVYSSVAAGVLLLVAVGLHTLYGGAEETGNSPVIAGTRPVQTIGFSDTALADSQAVKDAPVYVAPNRNAVFAEAVPLLNPVEHPAENEGVETENATHPALVGTPLREGTATQSEVPLLVENTVPVQPDTPQVAAAQRRVFERTSSRLVCGGGCTPKRSQTDARGLDAPQLAFINNSGTGANFELGSISF